MLVYALLPPTAHAAGSQDTAALPYEVFIDSHDPTAVWGRFNGAPPRILFDRTVPIRFKGLDETGRALSTPVAADRLNTDFQFYAQFSRVTSASLSSDHSRVVFSDDSSDSYPWSGYFDVRTGQAWFLARVSADSAAWSPDMKHVALQQTLPSGNVKVFIVDPENPFTPGKPWRGTQQEIGGGAVGLNDGEYTNREDGAIEETLTHVMHPVWTSTTTLTFQVLRVKSSPDPATPAPGMGRGASSSQLSDAETWGYDIKAGKASKK